MKISTGRISIENTKEIILNPMEGDLYSIIVINGSTNITGAKILIISEYGEILVDKVIDNKSMIFYPQNHNAKNGIFLIDSPPSNLSQEAQTMPPYYIDGKIKVKFENFGLRGEIHDLIFCYKKDNTEMIESLKSISTSLLSYALGESRRQGIEEIRGKAIRGEIYRGFASMGKERQKEAS